MAIQIIQAMVGYQLMTIMVSTIKAHHLTGGSLPLATPPAAAPASGVCAVAAAISSAAVPIATLLRFAP